jgi:hypothetical protein
MKTITREEWLTQVVKLAEDAFKFAGLEYPKSWRVSCGFPCRNATGATKRRTGECHSSTVSADNHFEMFVSPVLGETRQAIKTLLHEVVHACVGTDKGHRKEFSRACKRLGFEGKPTQAEPSDEAWGPFFEVVVAELGEYPHATLSVNNKKKQSTRMIKVACPCGCNVRMTRKWIEEVGPPVCGCGEQMEVA